MNRNPDYALLDDPALLAARAQVRAELDDAAARYQELTDELDRRARIAWTPGQLGGTAVMDDTARLLAVEVLLAEPETLGNDALEGDLYILRDRLRGNPAGEPASLLGTVTPSPLT